MSVVIKGMDMPKNCFTDNCPCLNGESGYCQADKDRRYVYDDRPYWCPLFEVPEHGELIERKTIHELVNWTLLKPPFSRKQVRHFIDTAPTIIPADREVNDV